MKRCLLAVLAVVVAPLAWAVAAEKPDELDDRVTPAGWQPADRGGELLVKHLPSGARVIVQNENPFHLTLSGDELGKDASGIGEIYLQVFDSDAAPGGRWKGYGLMELKTERVSLNELRVLSASIDFEAKGEGIYCLRTVARDRAGNAEKKSDDLHDVQWVVTLDRTPPKVELVGPQGGGAPLEVGGRLAVSWRAQDTNPVGAREKPGVVEVSRDGGKTWKQVAEVQMTAEPGRADWKQGRFEWTVDGPGGGELLVRVSVRDAANNRAVATISRPLAVAPTQPPPKVVVEEPSLPPVVQQRPPQMVEQPPSPSVQAQALGAYQHGVIYMTRGDLKEAVEQFNEALRLDRKMAPAYVDLSACYLRLYDADRALGAGYLDLAARAAADGVKALPGEVALYYNLAQAQYRLGKPHAAAASLQAGLAVKPRHVESLYMLAMVRAGQGRTADAVTLWRQVAAVGGTSDRLVERRLAAEAVRCLAEAEKDEPRRAAAATKPAGSGSAVQ